MNDIKSRLLALRSVKCDIEKLKSLINKNDYADFASTINSLVDDKVLEPIIRSGTNGMNPPLYQRYRIIRDTDTDPAINAEIDSLSLYIDNSKFLTDTKKYTHHRDMIQRLDRFLKANEELLLSPLSENERAYQIWGDEKLLDDSNNIRLLKECGIWEKLNTYPTPEPFFSYNTSTEINDILVIENKDTWFSLRRLMIECGFCTVFGKNIDCIIYGEGNKITKTGYSLTKFLETEVRYTGNIWYWGDIDYEGIKIFLNTTRLNPELDIKLFIPAYTAMAELFDNRLESIHDNMYRIRKNQARPDDIELFYNELSHDTAAFIDKILRSDMYIPQEIVNLSVLQRYVRRR